MILFIRDNECFEPRVQNYLHYFDENNIEYHVLAWNRNGSALKNEKITFFERRAEYGKRIANIPNKIAWMFFVMKGIWKYRKKCVSIHACDIDAVLPALLMRRLTGSKVIFDIFDWISSLTGKGVIYKVVEFLQNYAYKHSDAVILCEEERKTQAKSFNPNIWVLPNIPDGKVTLDSKTMEVISEQRKSYRLTISYVGVFDHDRGLENLLKCVSERNDILLNIAGFGVLDNEIQAYAKANVNICYWGRVEYAVGQTIQKNSDLIAAMYHLTSPLHKYAAPNKYYESLLLAVPMITTNNTLVGSKVNRYETGFVIGEDITDLTTLLDDKNLKKEAISKAEKCKMIWSNIYSGYYNKFMREKYLTF